MQDVCRCRIVPASALPKVLICTLQTMRHWGRLQWGESRGGVVLLWRTAQSWWYLLWGEPETGCCLVDWAGRGLVTVSITPPLHPLPLLSCSPPPVLLLSPGHWSPGASLPWIQLQQMQTFLCLPASISSLDSRDNADASKCWMWVCTWKLW